MTDKIYISGPMTGIKDLNFPEFNRVAEKLRTWGFDVVNPAEINPDPLADWFECIIEDIKAVRDCDRIYMLRGWEQSPGANIEYWTAVKYNKKINYQAND